MNLHPQLDVITACSVFGVLCLSYIVHALDDIRDELRKLNAQTPTTTTKE